MIADKMGGPAFPVSSRPGGIEYGHQDSESTWQYPGMTLWDYYAAAALQGCLASDIDDALSPALAAQEAADMADHMIAERAKRMEQSQ